MRRVSAASAIIGIIAGIVTIIGGIVAIVSTVVTTRRTVGGRSGPTTVAMPSSPAVMPPTPVVVPLDEPTDLRFRRNLRWSMVAAILLPVWGTLFVIPAFVYHVKARRRYESGDPTGAARALRSSRRWWKPTLVVETVFWSAEIIGGVIAAAMHGS